MTPELLASMVWAGFTKQNESPDSYQQLRQDFHSSGSLPHYTAMANRVLQQLQELSESNQGE